MNVIILYVFVRLKRRQFDGRGNVHNDSKRMLIIAKRYQFSIGRFQFEMIDIVEAHEYLKFISRNNDTISISLKNARK